MNELLLKLKTLFTSKRFVSFYWNTGYIVFVGFFDIFMQSIGIFNLPEWAVVGLGLAIAQISKALKNKADGRPMGFGE